MSLALGQSLFDLRGTQFKWTPSFSAFDTVVSLRSFLFVQSGLNSRQLAHSTGARDWPGTFIVVIGKWRFALHRHHETRQTRPAGKKK